MNKTIMVTGANRGIGLAVTKALVSRGAQVVMAVRDTQSGQAAASSLRQEIPAASLEVMQLDLSSLSNVRRFASEYLASGKPLHALVNNAAPISTQRKLEFTPDGFESLFGINYLAHFLLTNLLLPVLKSSAPSRVVMVSSIRHRPAKEFDWDNLKGQKSYDQSAFYNRTKLAGVWFTYALARRLEGTGVTAVAVCPGFVPQTLLPTTKGFSRLLYQILDRMPFARKPAASGEDFARIILDPDYAQANAAFFSYGKSEPSSELSYDVASQERLWALSAKLVGLAD